jgi:serine/threonine-protein kinase HipA
MSAALDVFLHERRVGRLERRSQARLGFRYLPEALEDPVGPPLSLALPLRTEPFDERECGPFFAGLLPEGEFLRAIARAFHVSAENAFGLLAAVGGECAGAVSLGAPDRPAPGLSAPAPRWLGEAELAELMAALPERPLLIAADEELGVAPPPAPAGDDDGLHPRTDDDAAGEAQEGDDVATPEEDDGIRLSLAGTNDKMGVLVDGGRIGIARGRPPTTHILKTPLAFSEAIANEAYCMTLAAEAGLEVAPVEPRRSPGRSYLLVRRYDRDPASPDGRLHQEDFCQALGRPPALKYEAEGGPGVEECAGLLRRHSAAPAADLIAFCDALLMNFAIGNHDAHSKNYSLLLEGPGGVRLAPLYDLLSSAVYPGLSRKMAMKWGGEYRPRYVRGRHLERLAGQLGVRPALVAERAGRLIELLPGASERAREALPGGFGRAEILDAIDRVVGEQLVRLDDALGEM